MMPIFNNSKKSVANLFLIKIIILFIKISLSHIAGSFSWLLTFQSHILMLWESDMLANHFLLSLFGAIEVPNLHN